MAKVELVLWELKFEKLKTYCEDTGWEDSPYYEKFLEHQRNKPDGN